MSNDLYKNVNQDEGIDNISVTDYLSKFREKLAKKFSILNSEIIITEEDLKVIDQLLEAFKRGYFAQILELNENKHQVLSRIFNSEPILAKLLKQKFIKASEDCKIISRNYPALIQQVAQQEKIEIDKTSAHPKYTFCKGFIMLEIDDREFKARAYTREGNLFIKPFDIQLVVSTIKQEINRIFGRPFNSNQFAKMLYQNYSIIIKKEKKKIGEPIPIRKITTRLGKNKKNFRTDEFIVDFSRLIESETPLIYKIDLDNTKDDRSGILLYQMEAHGYIGFIRMRKEEAKL